jgi:hypothetical protein
MNAKIGLLMIKSQLENKLNIKILAYSIILNNTNKKVYFLIGGNIHEYDSDASKSLFSGIKKMLLSNKEFSSINENDLLGIRINYSKEDQNVSVRFLKDGNEKIIQQKI